MALTIVMFDLHSEMVREWPVQILMFHKINICIRIPKYQANSGVPAAFSLSLSPVPGCAAAFTDRLHAHYELIAAVSCRAGGKTLGRPNFGGRMVKH